MMWVEQDLCQIHCRLTILRYYCYNLLLLGLIRVLSYVARNACFLICQRYAHVHFRVRLGTHNLQVEFGRWQDPRPRGQTSCRRGFK